jgi:hypothetical protein
VDQEEDGGVGGKFIRDPPCYVRAGRARPRYPGVEDEFRRVTFLGETHPSPSWLRYCVSKVGSSSTSAHRADEGATTTTTTRRRRRKVYSELTQ